METSNPISHLKYIARLVCRWVVFLVLLTADCICCNSQGFSRKQELKLRIVYDYQVDSDSLRLFTHWQDIYSMDPYGGDIKRLTTDHRSHSPAWSPDGKQIAYLQDAAVSPVKKGMKLKEGCCTSTFYSFYYELAAQSDLILMPLNGTDSRKVATVGPVSRILQWLPNAQSIALRSSGSLNPKVCVAHGKQIDAKCDRMETLEDISEEEQSGGKEWQAALRAAPSDYEFDYEFYPAVDNILPTIYMHWGDLRLWSRKEVENLGLGMPFFADLDASLELKSLDGVSVQAPVAANDTAWSPDGKRIAYSIFSDGHNSVLCVSDLRDNHVGTARVLTEPALEAHSPVWSADGSRIAFTGLWKGTQQLFAVNADGTGLIQISRNNNRFCSHPSWSPEGLLIVAECHGDIALRSDLEYMNTVPSIYLDISGWGSSIYLFDMNRLGADPRVLIKCNPHVSWVRGESDPHNCGAHNPSFAPRGIIQ